jgi:hypothetical protein
MARTYDYDPEAEAQRREREMQTQTREQVAGDRARNGGFDPRELLSEKWIDAINDLDIDRDLPDEHPAQHNVEQKLGAHTSKQFGIGYIDRQEYEQENLRDRGRRRLMNASYRRRGGSGSKCTGRTRARLTGGESDERPRMDADLSDQLDAGFEGKRMQRSGSVHGRRFKGSTEVQVVTSNDNGGLELGGNDGWLSKFTGGFLG